MRQQCVPYSRPPQVPTPTLKYRPTHEASTQASSRAVLDEGGPGPPSVAGRPPFAAAAASSPTSNGSATDACAPSDGGVVASPAMACLSTQRLSPPLLQHPLLGRSARKVSKRAAALAWTRSRRWASGSFKT